MEISNQTIHDTELITWIDKDLCITCPGCNLTLIGLRCTFKGTGCGCTHSNDFIATRLGFQNQVNGCLWYVTPFTVHNVVGNICGTHRHKCTSTDMQGHKGFLNTFGCQFF